MSKRDGNYRRVYALLKAVGHSPLKAGQIVLDARRQARRSRLDPNPDAIYFDLRYVKLMFKNRRHFKLAA